MPSRRLPALALIVVLAAPALADDAALRRLEDENAQLRARVAELEKEVATLKREAPSAPLAAAMERRAEDTITTSDGATGTIAIEPSLLERQGGAQSRHWVALRTRGDAGGPVQAIIETDASGSAYRGVETLTFIVDGQPFPCAVTSYRTEAVTAVRQGSRVSVKEILFIDVPPATLARLADAREVQGQLGPMRFMLTPEQLASIRAFQRRVAG